MPDFTQNYLTVVLGDYSYRVFRPWGELPRGIAFSHISQLALDRHDRVYVFQRGNPPVLVFEPSGAFAGSWGEGAFCDAHGITITADDRVFLVDRDAHQVLIYGLDGQRQGALGERHRPRFQQPFNHPTAVAVAADGEIYVADGYGNSNVHRFSAGGELMQTWGEPGPGPGQFSTPHDILIDQQDRVLVADREHNRVQVFDRDGRYLSEWGDFYHPMAIFQDCDGFIYITDQIPRLSMLAPTGELVGRCRPVLNMPHGLWGNTRGDLFIAEMNPTRVTKLERIDDN